MRDGRCMGVVMRAFHDLYDIPYSITLVLLILVLGCAPMHISLICVILHYPPSRYSIYDSYDIPYSITLLLVLVLVLESLLMHISLLCII